VIHDVCPSSVGDPVGYRNGKTHSFPLAAIIGEPPGATQLPASTVQPENVVLVSVVVHCVAAIVVSTNPVAHVIPVKAYDEQSSDVQEDKVAEFEKT